MTIFTIVERTSFLKWGERAQRNDRQKNQQFEHQHQRQQQQQKQKRKKRTGYIEFKFDITNGFDLSCLVITQNSSSEK